MHRAYIFTAIIIASVLFFQLVVVPYQNKKSAMQVVLHVLNNWQSGEALSEVDYWKDPRQYPPVSSLKSYKITWRRFYRVNNLSYVEIFVQIDFGHGSSLPNNQEWMFKLANLSTGWRVVDFRPSSLRGLPYKPPTRAYDPQADRKMLKRFEDASHKSEVKPVEEFKYEKPVTPQIPTVPAPVKDTSTHYRTIPAAATP